ncbi:MAG: signal peptidase II [Phycisphaeraceae bacterium]
MSKHAPAQPDAKPIERTGRSLLPWAIFVVVMLSALVADLGLKAWSFEHVAGAPVKVQTAEAGGPEVLVQSPETGQWVLATEVGLTDIPERVPRHEPIVVVPGLLNFQLTLNTGAVFGTGQGMRPVFIAVSVVAVVVILVLMARSPRRARVYHVALALILGGALGNLYDRVMYSAVRDMLHMLPSTGLWPWIFNPADVALVVGVGLVLVVSYLSDRAAAKQKAAT